MLYFLQNLLLVRYDALFPVNDALDDILADSDDESEEQAVIDKVLDEIGIEISGKVTFFNFSHILEVPLHFPPNSNSSCPMLPLL